MVSNESLKYVRECKNNDLLPMDLKLVHSTLPFSFFHLDEDLAAYFVRAMYHIERYTCVKFRRKMANEKMASGYIHMQKSPKL